VCLVALLTQSPTAGISFRVSASVCRTEYQTAAQAEAGAGPQAKVQVNIRTILVVVIGWRQKWGQVSLEQ